MTIYVFLSKLFRYISIKGISFGKNNIPKRINFDVCMPDLVGENMPKHISPKWNSKRKRYGVKVRELGNLPK